MRSSRFRLRADFLKATVSRLRLFLALEWRILAIIFSYSIAIGLFTLVVPLTVQELVSTFSFAIQPIMIVTLSSRHSSSYQIRYIP